MALDFTAHYDLYLDGVALAWEMYDDGYASSTADNTEDIALLRVPGGDTTVIQSFGRTTRDFEVPIAVNNGGIAAIAAKRGRTVTLARASGDSVSAFFVGLTNARKAGADLGVWRMTLKFVA